MAHYTNTREIALEGGRHVLIRELSVAQARQLLTSPTDADLISAALLEDMRLSDLPLFTDLTAADIDAMTPSHLREIATACKEQNPDFFAMLARLQKASSNR